MGVVYEGEDLKLGRRVALKLISAKSEADVIAVERFWREARTASALNHPGICTIFEINDSEAQPFLVMELLEGQTLDRTYSGHAMPLPRLVELGVQLADALDSAHRRGILHRDIKPSNIFITGSGQAKILDFGLARFQTGTADSTDDGTRTDQMLTSPGSTLGTIAYMSPEQARGETLDARSDIFSLGVVLYEMSTGRHPFQGTTSAVVFDKLLNYVPAAPISLNHELPPEFENILSKALEKDREMRYQSAADLRADLRRLQRSSSSARIAAVPAAPPATRSYPGMTRVDSAPKISAAAAASNGTRSAAPSRTSGSRLSSILRLAGLGIAAIILAIGVVRHIHNTRLAAASIPAPAVPQTAPAPAAPVAAAVPPAKPSAAISAAPEPTPNAEHARPSRKARPETPPPAAQPVVAHAAVTASAPAAVKPAPAATQPAAPKVAAAPAIVSYPARHMRLFGRSSSGTLRLTPASFTYTAQGDSVSLPRTQIRAIDGNTVVSASGKRWRFEITGMSSDQVHNLLAHWVSSGAASAH